jgi:hypothetical protein
LILGKGHVLFDVLSELGQGYLAVSINVGKRFSAQACEQHFGEGPVLSR